MAGFSTTAKNIALDALTLDRVRLHSGDPGASGTSNTIAAAGLTAATFAAASGGERALSGDVAFSGMAGGQPVYYWSGWNNNGGSPVYLVSGAISVGDVVANAAGEFRLKATTTKAVIS